jgi:Icc-related predicted phosphoesterase
MRILAASDLHGFDDVYEWLVATAAERRPDMVVLADDLLGAPDGYESVEAAQRADRERIVGRLARLRQRVLYVMGNDDWIEPASPSDNCESIHGKRAEHGALSFVGYQFTPPFMGGITEKPEEEMRVDLEALRPQPDDDTILVTHGPAHVILDRGLLDQHVGSVALAELISRCPFRAHIHGHIHGEFGREDRHFNVASGGHKRAMIIDVSTMTHEVLESRTAGD